MDESCIEIRHRLEDVLPMLVQEIGLLDGGRYKIPFSLGAAQYPEHADDAHELLALADAALSFPGKPDNIA